jgi:DNA-binding MarR family transcriptional regulator
MTARVDLELAGNAEVIVVTYLDVHGPSRPADIVTFTGMTSGGVTKLLDRLEKGGYLTREFGTFPGDRRATLLALTPAGTRLASAYADALRAVSDEVREATARLCAAAR